MGVRVDLALWIYRDHWAALVLLGAFVAAVRITSRVVLGAYALALVLLVTLAAFVVTAGLVWCVARAEEPSLAAVVGALKRPLARPGPAFRMLVRAVVRRRVQLIALVLAALVTQQLITESVSVLSETVSILGDRSELTRLWIAGLGVGLLEPVLYIATALWLFDAEP